MPSALVTMVFTDLVDSTAVKAHLPGHDVTERNTAYRDTILLPHRAKVQKALAEHGGRVVKTEGDAFFLVFPSATKAALWAMDVQRSHQNEPIATPLGSLRVKIGMHSGAPLADPEDPNDFVGSEVDYAARIAALASGGQIVLSEVTSALLRAEGAGGFEIHAHGAGALKGIGRVPVFELLYDGKPPQPTKAGDSEEAPTNLPPEPEGFKGRAELLQEIRERIRSGGISILKGEGGIGKTTLALRSSHDAQADGDLPGGVAWVNCELEPDLEECLRQAAKVFFGDRMEREPFENCRSKITQHLNQKGALIVLDNFETVARDASLLRWLAELRGPARVLVTTREVLPGLAGRVFEVRELKHDEAMAIFIERGNAAGLTLAENDPTVSALCHAVGDLPLAIRLLAARAARIPLPRLLERVKMGLEVLKTQDPTLPDHHQSARACFQLSLAHLSEPARKLLLGLSVLPDGAGPAVVTAVAGGDDWEDPAEELVAASVWRLETAQIDVHPAVRQRFVMHPLVRQFALEQLGEKRGEVERRIAVGVAKLVKANAQRAAFGQANQEAITRALDWCEVERQMLLACAQFAFQAEEWQAVYDLAATIFNFWKVRGYWSDAERLYELTLEATRRAGEEPAQANTLNFLGNIHQKQGRFDQAEAAHRQALAIWRACGDRGGEGNTLKHLARVLERQGQYEESEAACLEALKILRELGDRIGEAKALIFLGNAYRCQMRWDDAEREYRAAWQLSQQIGDRYDEGDALNYLGHTYQQQGRYAESDRSFDESLQIWRIFGDRRRQGITLFHWARSHQDQGQLDQARTLATQAIRCLEATDDSAALGRARNLLTELT